MYGPGSRKNTNFWVREMNIGKSLLLFFLVLFIGGPIYLYASHQKSVASIKLAAEKASALAIEAANKAAQSEQDSARQKDVLQNQAQTESANQHSVNLSQIQAGTESASNRADREAISVLEAKTAASLKDPGSAQFRKLELKLSRTILCGEVNAKNGFGGYVGFRPFVTTETGTTIWNGGCSRTGDLDVRLACLRESNVYIAAAVRSECKSQQEINATLLQ